MKFKLLLIIVLVLYSCVRQPNEPVVYNILPSGENGAYILCEGLYQMDNSSLSRYDFNSNSIYNDYFSLSNPGLRIGDTANDIAFWGDTAFIAITVSNYIQVFQVSSGKSLGQIFVNGNKAPRKICIVNDTVAFFTNLLSSSITKFNPKTFQIITEIPVGPYPEDIVYWDNFVFVANSGFGDYYQNLPKAGTISVVDVSSNQEVFNIDSTPNAVKLLINPKNKMLYIGCYTLYSTDEQVGNIIEYNLVSWKEQRRWKTDITAFNLSRTGDTLYWVNNDGLNLIDLTESEAKTENIISNPNQNEHWYSVSVNPNNDEIWIGNAKNYQINGEIFIFNTKESKTLPKKKFEVGINPNKILFF